MIISRSDERRNRVILVVHAEQSGGSEVIAGRQNVLDEVSRKQILAIFRMLNVMRNVDVGVRRGGVTDVRLSFERVEKGSDCSVDLCWVNILRLVLPVNKRTRSTHGSMISLVIQQKEREIFNQP